MIFYLAKMSYRKNELLEKTAIIKWFEYSPWGSELGKQTDIAKNNIKNKVRFRNLKKREEKETNNIDKSNICSRKNNLPLTNTTIL